MMGEGGEADSVVKSNTVAARAMMQYNTFMQHVIMLSQERVTRATCDGERLHMGMQRRGKISFFC